jgi:hypothetical protein
MTTNTNNKKQPEADKAKRLILTVLANHLISARRQLAIAA